MGAATADEAWKAARDHRDAGEDLAHEKRAGRHADIAVATVKRLTSYRATG